MCSAPRPAAGFTLVETVVALVIFAAAGMALYGLLSTNLITLMRAQDVSRQAPAVREAMERLASMNPWQQDEGQFEVDGFRATWTARLVEPMRQSQTAFGIPGPFNIGLYEIEIEFRQDGQAVGVWRMRHVGYEDMRPPTRPARPAGRVAHGLRRSLASTGSES